MGKLLEMGGISELIRAALSKPELVLKNVELVNVFSQEIYRTDIGIQAGLIVGLGSYSGLRELDCSGLYAVPGLIDAHTHLEMSMLSPIEFAKCILARGTCCIIQGPHEIANVLGARGIRLLIRALESTPLKFYLMIPPCVPASKFEICGARLDSGEITKLLELDHVLGLAELMDYPGVLNLDPQLISKLETARGKLVDGHCPGLSGNQLCAYSLVAQTDHESIKYSEAIQKLRLGLRILIREGSSAKNLAQLSKLERYQRCMLVTDGDRPADDLLEQGYLDWVLRRAIQEGIDPIKAIQMCTLNPAEHYGLRQLGAIAPGRAADLILVSDLEKFQIKRVFIDGKPFEELKFREFKFPGWVKLMRAKQITPEQIAKPSNYVIQVIEGQIYTKKLQLKVDFPDPSRDLLKLVAVDRYKGKHLGVGYVKGFGLERGALAMSISHDSHNIVCVGASDQEVCKAVNQVIELGGGIVLLDPPEQIQLPLPIAGLMSDLPAEQVARKLIQIRSKLKQLGCGLSSPLVTLSFLCLSVIPELKLTPLGLVDVESRSILS